MAAGGRHGRYSSDGDDGDNPGSELGSRRTVSVYILQRANSVTGQDAIVVVVRLGVQHVVVHVQGEHCLVIWTSGHGRRYAVRQDNSGLRVVG